MKIPKRITRPLLMYYESKFGTSARIFYPSGHNEFLHFGLVGDVGFGLSVADNDFILGQINQKDILHWEYL